MAETTAPALWKTKTFWAAVATVATGVGLAIGGDYVQGVQTALMGILAIFGRNAILSVTPSK